MFYRKEFALMAVAGLLASAGFAKAEGLTLDPTMKTAQEEPTQAPLMALLGQAGMDKPLHDANLNIYGWIEAGYTYNHRHGDGGIGPPGIVPGPFNHEVGNHFMLNQVALRFERTVDSTKFDVGGMIDLLYGTDAGFTHSTGMPFNGNDPSDNNSPFDAVPDKYQSNYQFDILQAYLDVNIPVGNGLKVRMGKFVTLLGYETIDPRGNAFYSHSYSFGALPFTQTGVLGTYAVNEQFSITAGITRGWDQTFEDSGPEGGECAIDGLGQFAYVINKQMSVLVNWSVGPQNFDDTSHIRTAINPIFYWQVTDALKLGVEGLYIYDGGLNQVLYSGNTHAYGDIWSITLYAGYTVNEYLTVNTRLEKYHTSVAGNLGAVAAPFGGSLNVYSITLGTTITPMPKDAWGKNISFRPEVRYDFTDSSNGPFVASDGAHKDQLTFAVDMIVKF